MLDRKQVFNGNYANYVPHTTRRGRVEQKLSAAKNYASRAEWSVKFTKLKLIDWAARRQRQEIIKLHDSLSARLFPAILRINFH